MPCDAAASAWPPLIIKMQPFAGPNLVEHLAKLSGHLVPHSDLLHCSHVPPELTANDLHGMGGDGLVDGDERQVVNAVVSLVELRADDARVDLGHEVLQHGDAGLRVQVAAVLGRVGDHPVHLIELLARNGVGDQRGLMQRLIVGALRLHADIDHLLEGQLDAGLHHGHHNKGIVEVLLLWDVHLACRSLLESSLRGLLAPLQKVDVVVVPVLHHGLREVAGDDVVLVLHIERPHDCLQLLRQLEALDLRGVVQAIHHPRDPAVLEGLRDRLPAVLDQLGGVARSDAVLDHLVEAQHCPCLQHATEDRLLAHEVTLDLRDEGAQQDARAIAAGGHAVGLGDVQPLALWVVLGVDSD
mmetsp:Transcript_71567/g.185805  ORF Transcript_71567/g.185805 Transcript_71567/m.185805 type:complete len:356 (+) Transcript_71567:160-1227(+)